LFPEANLDDAALLAKGVRFGKGLQLVNVLRDLPADLLQGRCYLPAERLSAIGLKPEDLLQSGNEPRLRPLYQEYLNRAEAHLQAGWDYTNTLPRRHTRVRLACAWPILIGIKTLELLRSGNVLEAQRRIKVGRPEIKRIMVRSILRYPFASAWKNQFPRSAVLSPA
jgi:farnesyl-diphosphate farnesyltransferase